MYTVPLPLGGTLRRRKSGEGWVELAAAASLVSNAINLPFGDGVFQTHQVDFGVSQKLQIFDKNHKNKHLLIHWVHPLPQGIMIWDLNNLQYIGTLPGHRGFVKCLHASYAKKVLCSGHGRPEWMFVIVFTHVCVYVMCVIVYVYVHVYLHIYIYTCICSYTCITLFPACI